MRMYGPIRTDRGEGDVCIVAGPSRFALFTASTVALGLGIGVFFTLRAARVNRTGDPTGEYVLTGLLAIAGLGALLMVIARSRRRIILGRRNGELIAETRGLTTSQASWRIAPDDFLIFATMISHHSTEKGSQVTKSYRLHAASAESKRTELLRSRDGETLRSLAHTLAKEIGLSIEVIEYSDTDSEQLCLDRLQVDRLRCERDRALGEMRSQANELENRQKQIEASAEIAGVGHGITDEERKQLEQAKQVTQVAKSEVRQAELEACLQDISNYEFVSALPGNVVEFTRHTLPADQSLIGTLMRPATVAISILLFILTPVVMALVGMFLVAIVDQMPASEMTSKLRQTFVDMFAFGGWSFLWTPVWIGLYGAWTMLKVDAAFSPYRVRIDWGTEELTIDRGRAGKRTIPLNQIHAVNTSTVHTKQQKESEWKQFAQLSVEAGQIGKLPLIDDSLTSSDSNAADAAGCLKPFADILSQSLHVPLHEAGLTSENHDPAGYPYRPNIFHCVRIWRLAGNRSRRSVIMMVIASVVFFLFVFSVRFYGQ